MSTSTPISEIPVVLRISEKARVKLTEQAAHKGQDLSAAISELVEQAVKRPSVAQIMAPVRKQAARSGMNERELDDFLRRQLEDHRREKKAKSA